MSRVTKQVEWLMIRSVSPSKPGNGNHSRQALGEIAIDAGGAKRPRA